MSQGDARVRVSPVRVNMIIFQSIKEEHKAIFNDEYDVVYESAPEDLLRYAMATTLLTRPMTRLWVASTRGAIIPHSAFRKAGILADIAMLDLTAAALADGNELAIPSDNSEQLVRELKETRRSTYNAEDARIITFIGEKLQAASLVGSARNEQIAKAIRQRWNNRITWEIKQCEQPPLLQPLALAAPDWEVGDKKVMQFHIDFRSGKIANWPAEGPAAIHVAMTTEWREPEYIPDDILPSFSGVRYVRDEDGVPVTLQVNTKKHTSLKTWSAMEVSQLLLHVLQIVSRKPLAEALEDFIVHTRTNINEVWTVGNRAEAYVLGLTRLATEIGRIGVERGEIWEW